MDIKLAKYIKSKLIEDKVVCIDVILNDSDMRLSIPLDPENSDYAEIMRQVDAGELTIEEAE